MRGAGEGRGKAGVEPNSIVSGTVASPGTGSGQSGQGWSAWGHGLDHPIPEIQEAHAWVKEAQRTEPRFLSTGKGTEPGSQCGDSNPLAIHMCCVTWSKSLNLSGCAPEL
jgi:hypothetical protein